MRNLIAIALVLVTSITVAGNDQFASGITLLPDGRAEISGPVEITRTGSYVLTRNIGTYSMNHVPTITVSASYVTIDLNGFTVRGQEPTVLAENVDGLTIHGGTIDSSDRAVILTNVFNFVLRDLTITNREDPSIAIVGGVRGHLENIAVNDHVEVQCEGCIIIHNRFRGFNVSGDGNLVRDNAFSESW